MYGKALGSNCAKAVSLHGTQGRPTVLLILFISPICGIASAQAAAGKINDVTQ